MADDDIRSAGREDAARRGREVERGKRDDADRGDELDVTVGPNDLLVVIQKGEDFTPSERVAAALEELALALAESETAEVAGFSFGTGMALDSGFISGPDPMAIGCLRICGEFSISTGCSPSKSVIRCTGSYTASPGMA
jgi:hypothetical protein